MPNFKSSMGTKTVQKILTDAKAIAFGMKNETLFSEHVFLAMMNNGGIVDTCLTANGVDTKTTSAQLTVDMDGGLSKLPAAPPAITVHHSLVMVLDESLEIMKSMGDLFVTPEHLLIAMRKRMNDIGVAGDNWGCVKILKTLTGHDELQKWFKDKRNGMKVKDQDDSTLSDDLLKFGKDLTMLAKQGYLDPVIGRDAEIRRVIQILSRRTKNNPVLVGEPGVGKTAIVEGLAHRIVSGDVPESLKGRKVLCLDMSGVVAGTGLRGSFEEKLKKIIKAVQDSKGQIILFIDEIHTIVGAGQGSGGAASDAANMLKPALARGELRCIGATTIAEYRDHMEKDAALERRFQQVLVEEPSVEDTVAILRGLKEPYENFHKLQIKDNALVAAAQFSHRYITTRFLPDKAIDLLDEACSRVRIEIESAPVEIDNVNRQIVRAEMELMSLRKEKRPDADVQERKLFLEKRVADLNDHLMAVKTAWDSEKDALKDVIETHHELETQKTAMERHQKDGEAKSAGKVAEKIRHLEAHLKKAEEKLRRFRVKGALVREEVTQEEIANVIAEWTGIQVQQMLGDEKEKLMKLEEELVKRVVGQDHAVKLVSDAVRRSRSGFADPSKPMGSFLFVGPTGVGKTELAKTLAAFLFESEANLVRLDMSEYQENHTISKLIGSPPGYVGHNEGGQLTEAVRRKPYSVVLLDEVEKAHPEIFNAFLQVLDDGVLTDGQGRHVNFKNTIFIMTSNLGSRKAAKDAEEEDDMMDDAALANSMKREVKKFFRPEMLNRIDEIVSFNRMNEELMGRIVDIHLQHVISRAAEKKITLNVSPEARMWLAKKGYDPINGARPVKRLIQRAVVDEMAKLYLGDEVQNGGFINVRAGENKLELVCN